MKGNSSYVRVGEKGEGDEHSRGEENKITVERTAKDRRKRQSWIIDRGMYSKCIEALHKSSIEM